jgi:hypothetical protein
MPRCFEEPVDENEYFAHSNLNKTGLPDVVITKLPKMDKIT